MPMTYEMLSAIPPTTAPSTFQPSAKLGAMRVDGMVSMDDAGRGLGQSAPVQS